MSSISSEELRGHSSLYLENTVFDIGTCLVIGSSDKCSVRSLTTRDQRVSFSGFFSLESIDLIKNCLSLTVKETWYLRTPINFKMGCS